MLSCDVSVVIPAYNAEAFIVDALESVFGQTVLPKEIIVINDGSVDKTEGIIKGWISSCSQSCPVHLITRLNSGAPATRNVGIQQASAKWIAFLDADDVWESSHLEKLLEAANCMPTAVAAYGAGRLMVDGSVQDLLYDDFWDNPSKTYGKAIENTSFFKIDFEIFPRLIKGNFIKPSSLMVLKSITLDVGMFNECLRSAEDREFLVRLIRRGNFIYVPIPITKYRWHDDNLSQTKNAKNNIENGLRALVIIINNKSLNLSNLEIMACDREIKNITKQYLYICSNSGFDCYRLGLSFIRVNFGIMTMLKSLIVKNIFLAILK